MPTRRLFLLLLLAAPIGAAGGPLVLVAVAIGILALVAAGVDWVLAGDGRRVVARRVLATDKLSLGAWNPVQIDVSNPSGRQQRVQVRDLPPLAFVLDVQAPVFSRALAPRSEASVAYRVSPVHRGDARFADLYLRVDGPLRLMRRTFRQIGSAEPVRVYPNLRELRRYDLLVRRGLELQPSGRPVRVAGASTEFERVREYLPDDEFRRINWKAMARRGQPMVNQFEAERSQNLVVMLDAGRNMAALAEATRLPGDGARDTLAPRLDGRQHAFLPRLDGRQHAFLPRLDGGGDTVPPSLDADLGDWPADPGLSLTKLDHALNAALLLAYVASQRGDRVALLAYVDDVRTFVPPQRGRRALLATVGALYNLRAEPIEPDHGRAFDFLAQRNLRRSLVVLFTDLADRESSASLAAHIMRAARQHLVVCVTLGDPSIRRPAQRLPRDAASLYEKMVAQQLLDDRAAVLAQLSAHGVLTVDTDADKLSPRLIGTYLELKQRGRV